MNTLHAIAAIILMAAVTSCCTSRDAASTNTSSAATGTAAAASTVKPYTLDTCIVSDEKLGSMGEPAAIVHNGQEVKFCCKSCIKKFKANPEKYLSKLK